MPKQFLRLFNEKSVIYVNIEQITKVDIRDDTCVIYLDKDYIVLDEGKDFSEIEVTLMNYEK